MIKKLKVPVLIAALFVNALLFLNACQGMRPQSYAISQDSNGEGGQSVDDPSNPGTPGSKASCGMDPETQRLLPTYESHIKDIIGVKCLVCHSTAAGQSPNLETYQEIGIAGASQALSRIVETDKTRIMPPNYMPQLTETERHLFQDWVNAERPEDASKCPKPVVAPTCTVTANPSTINAGQSTQLTITLGGTIKTIQLDGTLVVADGTSIQRSVTPSATKTYSVVVQGPKVSFTCQAKVTVNGVVVPPPITNQSAFPKISSHVVNETRCTLCHTQWHGDLTSLRGPVDTRAIEFKPNNNASIKGKWMIAAGANFPKNFLQTMAPSTIPNVFTGPDYQRRPGVNFGLFAEGGIYVDHAGPEIPKDPTSKAPMFPKLDFDAIEKSVTGTATGVDLMGRAVNVNKVVNGDLFLLGTPSSPIVINGPILVKGFVLIKGTYRGRGTIYSTKSIFVPGNLLAVNSAFPYPEDPVAALAKANTDVVQNTDAMGLAANVTIVLGNFVKSTMIHLWYGGPTDNRIGPWVSTLMGTPEFLDHLPTEFAPNQNKFGRFLALSDTDNKNCNGSPVQNTFEMIDANLFAQNAVTGYTTGTSYAINGAILSDFYHIQSGARDCPDKISPRHGLSMMYNHIRFDYRLKTGKLQVLEYLAPYFQP